MCQNGIDKAKKRRIPMKSRKMLLLMSVIASLMVGSSAAAAHATDGIDVKVTTDNNNVDGGTPNPSFDAQNRQSNETTIAISPANPNISAAGANAYGMVPVTA